jgi:hypothetical protein
VFLVGKYLARRNESIELFLQKLQAEALLAAEDRAK